MLNTLLNKNHCADNYYFLKQLPDNSIDLIAADPPYGYAFMGRDWDKKVPSVETLQECNRVLKPGAFGFFVAAPRQDVLCDMMLNLRLAGFNMAFSSIYWTYATGFPKAINISKAIDKKLGVKREVVGKYTPPNGKDWNLKQSEGETSDHAAGTFTASGTRTLDITAAASVEAKSMEGSYGGFQPKPAVEIIIVAMKPMDKKTFVDQALHNGKGVTWLDDVRIPYTNDADKESSRFGSQSDITGGNLMNHKGVYAENVLASEKGRFPANMLVSDDVLNDGKEHPTGAMNGMFGTSGFGGSEFAYGKNAKASAIEYQVPADSGSYSRYFDLDAWFEQCAKHIPDAQWDTFPFLVVAKPAQSEKEMGLQNINPQMVQDGPRAHNRSKKKNFHPTVKPVKLMSYLIALGSREGDIVLDPWVGSGTTSMSAKMMCRKYIGIDDVPEHIELANQRCKAVKVQLKMF